MKNQKVAHGVQAGVIELVVPRIEGDARVIKGESWYFGDACDSLLPIDGASWISFLNEMHFLICIFFIGYH